MPNIQSLISEIDREFDATYDLDGYGDSHIVQNKVKAFYHSKIKQVLEEIIKAAPLDFRGSAIEWDDGFNQGRAQTLQVITDWLKGEEV